MSLGISSFEFFSKFRMFVNILLSSDLKSNPITNKKEHKIKHTIKTCEWKKISNKTKPRLEFTIIPLNPKNIQEKNNTII